MEARNQACLTSASVAEQRSGFRQRDLLDKATDSPIRHPQVESSLYPCYISAEANWDSVRVLTL